MTTSPDAAQIGILASRIRVDERRLFEAFDRRGIVCEQIDVRALHGAASADPAKIRLVLDREISMTRAAYGASLLECSGARVLNSSTAIRCCADKWETTKALHQAGVPTPRTVLAVTPEAALDAIDAMPGPVILKPLIGSWGRRIGRLVDRETAALVLEYVAALPSPQSHIVYLQELIEDIEADVRLLVVGDQVVGACARSGSGLRKNVALGGFSRPHAPSDDLVKLAVRATQCVGAELAGVDVLIHPDRGPLVLEVNAGVEFSGLQSALGTDVDVADAIARHVLEEAV